MIRFAEFSISKYKDISRLYGKNNWNERTANYAWMSDVRSRFPQNPVDSCRAHSSLFHFAPMQDIKNNWMGE